MVALPILTCGLAGFVPGLWAAFQRRQDRQFFRRMIMFSTAVAVLMVVGFTLFGMAPPADEQGDAPGVLDDIGAALLVIVVLASTGVAFFTRKARVRLPGTERELARRQQRQQYRRLITRDPSMARSINVGRPDAERDFDDGGLLDINTLSAATLSHFAPMSTEEAHRIVEVRDRFGRFSSLDEVLAYADLSEGTTLQLRERAVVF